MEKAKKEMEREERLKRIKIRAAEWQATQICREIVLEIAEKGRIKAEIKVCEEICEEVVVKCIF